MRRLRAGLFVLLALGLARLAAAAPVELHDARGRIQRWSEPPRRIVSLQPSVTEAVCALGACDRLVGVDRYSSWPAEVDKLPRLGGLDDAQLERIVALKPDVVLAAPSARVVERLEALDVRVLTLQAERHAEVQRSLEQLGRLLGAGERATALWAAIRAELARAAMRVPPALRGRRVYFEIAATPYAASASSFIGETLARLGLVNIVGPEFGPFPQINPEVVLRARPELMMAAAHAVAEMPRRPGWGHLAALREGRTCAFGPADYDVLVRPGPRLGEAARLIADCLEGLGRGGAPVFGAGGGRP